MRQAWITHGDTVSVARQCVLAAVSRATVYAHQKPRPVDELDLLHSRLIDEEYTRHPFYGSRKMVLFLKTEGHIVNRKRVQRLMRIMGLVAIAPGPNTSRSGDKPCWPPTGPEDSGMVSFYREPVHSFT